MKFKLLRHFKNMSITKKFHLSIIMIIVIPMITVFSVIIFQSYRELKNKMIENSQLAMQQAELGIQTLIEETEYLSLSMLIDPNIQELCREYKLDNTFISSAARQLYISMQDAVESKTYIDSVCVSYDGTILFQYGNKVLKETGSYQEQAREMAGRGFWTEAETLDYPQPQEGHYVVSYIRAFMDITKSNDMIGLQRISLSEEKLAQAYASLSSTDGSDAFIVNKSGTILSSADKKEIGTDVLRAYPLLNRIFSSDSGYFTGTLPEGPSLVVYQAISGTEWTLIQSVPLTALFSSSTLLFVFMAFSVLLLLLFSIIFSQIQLHAIIRPIASLSAEMEKVRDGNFDVSVSPGSQDEIGRLSTAFKEMLDRTKTLIEKVYLSQIREKESAYKALEAQINPHFLYNVLDSIHWTAVRQKDWEVSDRIEALSEFFRHVLNKGDTITTIREEVKYLKNYLFLQKNKFSGRIQVCLDIDEKYMDCLTIKLLLQPLVENAVNHGLAEKDGTGNISVWIEEQGDCLLIHVEDDGLGADEDAIRAMIYSEEETGNAFALRNIHKRIQLLDGAEYGLTFESMINVGTVVTARIPYTKGGPLNETDDRR